MAASNSVPFSELDSPERKRVLGLIRVSTADQANEDRGGIPRQRRIIEQTIARKNLDCIRIYEIADVSGTQVLNNPDIQEILKLVSSRVVTGLVIADLDRLFRPAQPTDYAILQAFKDTGAIIYSGDTEYDLTNRDSALFANIRSAISGFELQLMKDRQNGAREAKRRQGKCPTNELTLPIGVSFDRKQQRFFYNERIATVVELFRLYDQEGIHNYHELGRRTGLSNLTARNLLRNPLYCGWRVISQKRGDRTTSRTGKLYRKKTNRAPDEVIKVKVIETPAVSQECFDRVQASMDRVVLNHRESRKRDQAFNFGTGITRCGHCGEIFLCSSGKKTNGRRHGYYTCKANHYLYRERFQGCKQSNLRQPDLDALIEAFTVKTLTNASTLTELITGSLARSNEIISPFPVADGAAKLESLRKREKRLLEGFEAGVLSIEELRTRREEVRREVAKVESETSKPRADTSLELVQFVRLVVRGAMRLKRLHDRKEKKAIISSLFSEIYVKDQAITSFQFRSDLPLGDSVSKAAAKAPIQLGKPFTIFTQSEPVPADHKRCSCCAAVRPVTEYFPNKGECKPCIKIKASAAHQRRKAARNAGPRPDL